MTNVTLVSDMARMAGDPCGDHGTHVKYGMLDKRDTRLERDTCIKYGTHDKSDTHDECDTHDKHGTTTNVSQCELV